MPRISRYRTLLGIWIGVVMALFCLGMILPWYLLDWSSRVFGFNIFTLTQEGSYYIAAIVPIVWFLTFGPAALFCRWVRREKKAFAAGKRPCLHCGYDLQGHQASGSCPECGTEFELAEIERYYGSLSYIVVLLRKSC